MCEMKGKIEVPGHSRLNIEVVCALARNGEPHSIRLSSAGMDEEKSIIEEGSILPVYVGDGDCPSDDEFENYRVVATLKSDGVRHYTILRWEDGN